MNSQQQAFLEKLAQRIPRLFEVIGEGNEKCEYIIGTRLIGKRQVRLKLVAEVVDPGGNPLASHSLLSSVSDALDSQPVISGNACSEPEHAEDQAISGPPSRRRRPRKR